MAMITYILVEGDTLSDEDIDSFVEVVKTTLSSRFSPRRVQITIQDMLPEDIGLLTEAPKTNSDKISMYN